MAHLTGATEHSPAVSVSLGLSLPSQFWSLQEHRCLATKEWVVSRLLVLRASEIRLIRAAGWCWLSQTVWKHLACQGAVGTLVILQDLPTPWRCAEDQWPKTVAIGSRDWNH